MLAKLDGYDYELLPGIIRIGMSSTNDPDIVDILSEIQRSNNRIFVEGNYYSYLNDYRIYRHGNKAFMELNVEVA